MDGFPGVRQNIFLAINNKKKTNCLGVVFDSWQSHSGSGGWMAAPIFNGHELGQNSQRWRGTGRPGELQSLGSQRVGHDLAAEQGQKSHLDSTSCAPQRGELACLDTKCHMEGVPPRRMEPHPPVGIVSSENDRENVRLGG